MTPSRYKSLKFHFYQKTKQRVSELLGVKDKALAKYENDYWQELESLSPKLAKKKEFFDAVTHAEIIFFGDFHAHQQSTRSLLRVARQLKASNCVLALECLSVQFQPQLDMFIKGEMGEKDFLRLVEWKKNWGFPWEYVRPLLKWAAQNEVPVYAINQLKIRDLNIRDQYSTEHIKKIFNEDIQKHPGKKLIVQYGDFHLAYKHLPLKVKKTIPGVRTMTIFQSPEPIFFKLSVQTFDMGKVDFVNLEKNKWAMMTVVPWVKWQDYLLYLEAGYDRKLKSAEFEPTDHVSKTVIMLSDLLRLNVTVNSLSVYSLNDESILTKIKNLPHPIRNEYLELIKSMQSFYCPEIQAGFLARPSLNHISRVASQYILIQQNVLKKSFQDPKKDFLKLIWLEMIIYFFSKLMNPKRKSDTFDDIRQALKKESFIDRGREALTVALEQKMTEVQYMNLQSMKSGIQLSKKKYHKKSYLVASQILGGILGEKVYLAFYKKLFNWTTESQLVLKNLDDKHFNKTYYELIEMIESWPLPVKSKYDRF